MAKSTLIKTVPLSQGGASIANIKAAQAPLTNYFQRRIHRKKEILMTLVAYPSILALKSGLERIAQSVQESLFIKEESTLLMKMTQESVSCQFSTTKHLTAHECMDINKTMSRIEEGFQCLEEPLDSISNAIVVSNTPCVVKQVSICLSFENRKLSSIAYKQNNSDAAFSFETWYEHNFCLSTARNLDFLMRYCNPSMTIRDLQSKSNNRAVEGDDPKSMLAKSVVNPSFGSHLRLNLDHNRSGLDCVEKSKILLEQTQDLYLSPSEPVAPKYRPSTRSASWYFSLKTYRDHTRMR